MLVDFLDDFVRAVRDLGARPENQVHAVLKQEFVVGLRNHATCNQDDVFTSMLLQFFLQGWNEGFVACGQTACSDHVDVVVDCLASHFLGRGEERAYVHIVAQVSESTGDDFGSSVVSVLAHLGNQNAGVSAVFLRELLDVFQSLFVLSLALVVGVLHRFFRVGSTHD